MVADWNEYHKITVALSPEMQDKLREVFLVRVKQGHRRCSKTAIISDAIDTLYDNEVLAS